MNGLNNSFDDVVECPLCMEPLEVDDLNFFPCTCGYQICRFCWHRIRTDENKLCPACRKEYPENPADFTPLTQEEMIALKSQKRQRDQQRKQKITENRKHLANVRVVQKNLVFVVGLPPRLADADILKKHEYFGKYGKIHKVVINPSTAYAGVQGPSASAYVTYVHNSDALRAIQSVYNIMIDGRVIKTSLGTTKYCSYFMKNQQCPKNDCMYLHELGDSEASFTKEEMHQGKHQEYEKRLHDALIASSNTSLGTEKTPLNGSSVTGNGNGAISSSNGGKGSDNKGNSASPISNSNSLTASNDSTESSTSVSSSSASGSGKSGSQNKDAWPSLFAAPLTKEGSEQKVNKKKEKKNEKHKNEKSKSKNVKGNNNINSVSTTKANRQQQNTKDSPSDAPTENTNSGLEIDSSCDRIENSNGKSKLEKKEKEKKRDNSINKFGMSADEEIKLIEKSESLSNTKDTDRSDKGYDKNGVQVEDQRSLSSNSNASSNSDSLSLLSDSGSGKSTPDSPVSQDVLTATHDEKNALPILSNTTDTASDLIIPSHTEASKKTTQSPETVHGKTGSESVTILSDNLQEPKSPNSMENSKIMDVSASLSKLNLFDDSNSFFSAVTPLQQHIFKNKNQLGNSSGSQLPDLLNGIDGNLNNMANEWDEAFKNVVINNKHLEEQHRHLQQLHNQEELFRMQEFQKRGNHFSAFGLPMGGPDNDFLSGNVNTSNDFSRLSQNAMLQQQIIQQQSTVENPFSSSLFGTNMSKFFDFHKNQQQLNQQNKALGQHGPINQTQNAEQQHSRLQNQYTPNNLVDDELGFDPFIETQKALAELMENEVAQQNMNNSNNSNSSSTIASKLLHQQQHPLIDNMQRARMPPPGFNHMNAFGVGVPRPQNNNKMLPYMNATGSSGNHNMPMQQQQIPMSNSWNGHLNHRHSSLGDSLGYPFNQNHKNGIINKAGYSNNDWTAMDPAILSLRQFPTFPVQSQMPHNQQQQEMYLQQMNQQQSNLGKTLHEITLLKKIASSMPAGFNPQAHHGGMNNSLLNNQPSAPTQVNANVQGMLEYLKTRQFV